MIGWLLLAVLARADDAGLLAPGIGELEVHLVRAETLEAEAAAAASALARVQVAWVQEGCARGREGCPAERRADLAGRARIFGVAWRDLLQSTRAERDRVSRLAAEPTVYPLMQPEHVRRVDALGVRVDAGVRSWLTAVAWHRRFMDVAGEPALGPGFPAMGPPPARAAVIVAEGGRLCPDPGVERGPIVIVAPATACWSAGPCDCEPAPVWPGAVLGPAPIEPVVEESP